jgi:hypothetical protein
MRRSTAVSAASKSRIKAAPQARPKGRIVQCQPPEPRFTFTFTPTHGSWLNLSEGFFSELARSVLRHIRVSSKHELKERRIAFIGDINREPVVHT